jgi:hypothetical protein
VGNVISMQAHRQSRARSPRRSRPSVSFSFDLASPTTYLAAERVDRLFPGVAWEPVLGDALGSGPAPSGRERERRHASARARATELRMPLIWPDRPAVGLPAMRMSHFAVAEGHGGAFVLAASRLAFCGGFDLTTPRSSPRRPRRPACRSTRPAGRARTARATRTCRGREAASWPRAPSACPRCGSAGCCSAGEERLPEAAAAARATTGAATWVQHPGA